VINDMDGKIVESGVIKGSQIVTKDLSKGIYLLRIFNYKGIQLSSEKIVKK
jgi:hypothetical protein